MTADTNRAEPMKAKHDYPACAIYRGGKCTCDEADKLCPQCGECGKPMPGHAMPTANIFCDSCSGAWAKQELTPAAPKGQP